MAAEPWIDFGDTDYWQELIKQDIALAKSLARANQRFMSGYKCYEAAEKIVSCWYVSDHAADLLPEVESLSDYAEMLSLLDLLTPQKNSLFAALDTYKRMSNTPNEKEEFSSGLTQEMNEMIIQETEEFYSALKEKLAK